MRDLFGTPLGLGDHVVFAHAVPGGLSRGSIHRFVDNQVIIAHWSTNRYGEPLLLFQGAGPSQLVRQPILREESQPTGAFSG